MPRGQAHLGAPPKYFSRSWIVTSYCDLFNALSPLGVWSMNVPRCSAQKSRYSAVKMISMCHASSTARLGVSGEGVQLHNHKNFISSSRSLSASNRDIFSSLINRAEKSGLCVCIQLANSLILGSGGMLVISVICPPIQSWVCQCLIATLNSVFRKLQLLNTPICRCCVFCCFVYNSLVLLP